MAIDISSLTYLTNCEFSDNVHVLRNDERGILLSYKSKLNRLDSYLVRTTSINSMIDNVQKIETDIAKLTDSFLLKEEAIEKYSEQSDLDNIVPTFLTNDKMESILEKYVTIDDVKSKEATSRELAYKLADEFTDFGAAALVGIFQSKAAPPGSGDQNNNNNNNNDNGGNNPPG